MKSNPSKKHHYLPRHYLKGFTNKDGGFFVYDKQQDRIFSSSPDSTFFENDLNTAVMPKGQKSVFLEDQYTHIENTCWPSLDKIRASSSKTPIDFTDKEFLFMFLLFQYWRLPTNIPAADVMSKTAFTDTHPIDYFEIKGKTGTTVPEYVIETIRDSDAFRKSFRLILPFAPFLKDKKWGVKLQNWKFFYTHDDRPFYIVGDRPIISRKDPATPVDILEEFVFPVSGRILLVNTHPAPVQTLPPDFIIQYNTAMIDQAHRFVVCPDEKILQALIEYYKIYLKNGKTHLIKQELFDALDANASSEENPDSKIQE